jgi:hypothetical protein
MLVHFEQFIVVIICALVVIGDSDEEIYLNNTLLK